MGVNESPRAPRGGPGSSRPSLGLRTRCRRGCKTGARITGRSHQSAVARSDPAAICREISGAAEPPRIAPRRTPKAAPPRRSGAATGPAPGRRYPQLCESARPGMVAAGERRCVRARTGSGGAPSQGGWGAIPCRARRAGRRRWGEGASRPVSRVLYGATGEPAARDDHSSGTAVAGRLERSTRATARKRVGPRAGKAGPCPVAPIRSCSRWGLPCRRRCRRRGALLPHPFTLTRTLDRSDAGRSAFCGAFPRVAPAGRYPAPCFRGARTFLRGIPRDARGGRPAGWPGVDRPRGPGREGRRRPRGAGRASHQHGLAHVAGRAEHVEIAGRPRRAGRAPSWDCR